MQRSPQIGLSRLHQPTMQLFCPQSGLPITRAIVLDHNSPSSEFLESAAEICRECGIWPVVLTVARSEDEACCRQSAAESVFRGLGVRADFDYVVGSNASEAVVWAARWRVCCHVLVAPTTIGSYAWQRWRQDPFCGFVNMVARTPVLMTASRVFPLK